MAQVEKEKQSNWLLTGCSVGLLFVVLIVGVGIVLLSKTGLIGSAEAFELPAPVRVVETSLTSEVIQKTLVTSALQSYKQGTISVVITESMMTALLRDGLKQLQEPTIDATRAQIAVLDEGYAEIYIPLYLNERTTTVRARVMLVLEEGNVRLSVNKIQLGYVTIPGRFAAKTSEEALQKVLDTQLNQVQGALKLTDLQVQDGSVRLSGAVSINPLQLFQ